MRTIPASALAYLIKYASEDPPSPVKIIGACVAMLNAQGGENEIRLAKAIDKALKHELGAISQEALSHYKGG